MVAGERFDIRGICWNPVPQGHVHPQGLIFNPRGDAYDLALVEQDLKLIKDAGFNTLRTYQVINDPRTLALVESYGLKIIVPIFNFHKTTDQQIRANVETLKNHPTTLIWEIGNEWNYNNLYNPEGNFDESLARIQSVITLIRSTDQSVPLAINYGELPTKEVEKSLAADVWGLNIYRSDDFEDVFEKWQALSDKPMYIGEYGADAIDNRAGDGRYAPEHQAHAVSKLTTQIIEQYASRGLGPALGGALFEFSDEWWKDGNGKADVHDIGGIAPGGGPYPDLEFNEEWWGIVTIDRTPRPAYYAIQKLYNP